MRKTWENGVTVIEAEDLNRFEDGLEEIEHIKYNNIDINTNRDFKNWVGTKEEYDKITLKNPEMNYKIYNPTTGLCDNYFFRGVHPTQYYHPSVSTILQGSSKGLEFWTNEGTKIKIAGGKSIKECLVEETKDYFLYCDGQRVTVPSYVPGTYTEYLSRIKVHEEAKANPKSRSKRNVEKLPMLYVQNEPIIDHAKLLLDINKEMLQQLDEQPSTLEDPISVVISRKKRSLMEAPALKSRTIPIPEFFCARVDKKTGEIYFNKGYENLFNTNTISPYGLRTYGLNVQNNIASFFSSGKVTNYHGIAILSSQINNETYKEYVCVKCRVTLNGKYIPNDNIFIGATNSRTIANENKILENKQLENGWVIKKLLFSWFPETNQTNKAIMIRTINYSDMVEGSTIEQGDLKVEIDLSETIRVKSEIIKPYIKTTMPNGELTLITTATSITHSFILNNCSFSSKGDCWIIGRSDKGEDWREWVRPDGNIIINKTCLISNVYNTPSLTVREKGISSAEMCIGKRVSNIHTTGSMDTIKRILFYKNSLTEIELKAENEKNLLAYIGE